MVALHLMLLFDLFSAFYPRCGAALRPSTSFAPPGHLPLRGEGFTVVLSFYDTAIEPFGFFACRGVRQGDGSLSAVRQRTVPLSASMLRWSPSACRRPPRGSRWPAAKLWVPCVQTGGRFSVCGQTENRPPVCFDAAGESFSLRPLSRLRRQLPQRGSQGAI